MDPIPRPAEAPIPTDSLISYNTHIPDTLFSYETIVHVGFTTAKAHEVWEQWLDNIVDRWRESGLYLPDRQVVTLDEYCNTDERERLRPAMQDVVTFDDFIIGCIRYKPDADGGDSDEAWYETMDDCGINAETQAAIMDPSFAYLRQSNSCIYWLEDTIRTRYRGLEHLERDKCIARCSASTTGWQRISDTRPKRMPGISTDAWGSAAATTACNEPEHSMLYRVVDQARIRPLFDKQGNVDDISGLMIDPISDFSPYTRTFCFTPSRHLAEYQASYAKLRPGPVHTIVVVALRLPSSLIEDLADFNYIRHYHWPRPEWKEIVWKNHSMTRLPLHLREDRDNALIIVGSISRRMGEALRRKRIESPQELTSDFVVCMGPDGRPGRGPPATKVVFNTNLEHSDDPGRYETAIEWLKENADILAFPYTRPTSNLILGMKLETSCETRILK